MKRPFRWDKKYLYWGITAFLVIIGSILFFLILSQLSLIWGIIRQVLNALSPIIYGLIFAYLLNKLMSFFEASFLDRTGFRLSPGDPVKAKRISRIFGVLLTFIILIVIIGGMLALVIPQIYVSIQNLIRQLPSYYQSAIRWSNTFLAANPNLENAVAKIFGNITDSLTSWLQTTLLSRTNQILTDLTAGVFNILKILVSIVIGFIVSVYILHHKEKFGAQCKRLIFGLFKPQRANGILRDLRFLDKTVGGFFLGKIIESLIVGIITYVFLVIFGMPYPVLIAVLLAVTNLVPFFGVFIGAAPSALMILLEDPIKCLIFVIYIIVLHTFATNVLAPRVLGETVGLGGFWVLFAILLFGGLFGFWGLLFGVPVFAVIYAAVSGFNRSQLRDKNYPISTETYENILEFDPETGTPVYRSDEQKDKTHRKGKRPEKNDHSTQDNSKKGD